MKMIIQVYWASWLLSFCCLLVFHRHMFSVCFCFCSVVFSLLFVLYDHYVFHLSPRLCPSTAGCSPISVFHCLLPVAFLFQVVPPFLVMSSCHLLLGRPLDLFLSLVATLCSIWSTYCPSFWLYVWPISTVVSVCIL